MFVREKQHGDTPSKASYRLDAFPGASYPTLGPQILITVGGVREMAHGVPKEQPKVTEPVSG